MGIRVKQLDKKDPIRKLYLPIEGGPSACGVSSAYLKLMVCPVDGRVDGVVLSNRTGLTASNGNCLHVVVTNQTLGATILDYTKTGVAGGQSSEARWIINTSENNVADVCADSVITVAISTSAYAQQHAGYLVVTVADSNDARVRREGGA